jgi:cytochrome b561
MSSSNIALLCMGFITSILIIAQTSIAIQFYNNAEEQLESDFKTQYHYSIGILVATLFIVLLFSSFAMYKFKK